MCRRLQSKKRVQYIINFPISFVCDAWGLTVAMFRVKRASQRKRFAFTVSPIASAHNRTTNVVKVCGVTNVHDADSVGRLAKLVLPSDVEVYLGMILWSGSKRSVHSTVACDISRVARLHGMNPVGVFVDESSDDIRETCKNANINIAQLHGPKCRSEVKSSPLPNTISAINVIDVGEVEENTSINNTMFTLFDSPGGGTGRKFDWNNFTPPIEPWLLAGGLNPNNVAEAIIKLNPTGVDVASGVTCDDGVKKDAAKIERFLREFVDATTLL